MKAKALLLSAALALVVAACATTTSPTGRKQVVGGVSEAQLVQLGEQAFAQAKQQKPQSRDSRQTAYVRCVVTSIVRQLPADWLRLSWDVALFEDAESNAFALPGGKVGVYTGLLKVATDQDQLAAVIGHELAHVVSRHASERVSQQYAAETALKVLDGATGGERRTLLGLLGVGAQAGVLLPFSRQHESEADVLGQRYMANAGFDPRAAATLWENMQKQAGGSRPPAWLSTHPDPQCRIQTLAAAAPGLPSKNEQARSAGRRPNCR